MILTPAELDRRAQFYRELGQMTEVGLTIPKALETIYRHTRRARFKTAILRMLQLVNEGSTLGTALLSAGKWLSAFDIALLGAGEQSGRLPACFLKLASYYEERARLLRKILASLAYPLLLVHMALLVFPIGALQSLVTEGNIFGFIFGKLMLVLPVYLIGGVVAYLAQGERGEAARYMLDRFLGFVPVLGSARRSMALSRLCLSLEALINAGSNVIHSWELSAAACGSPVLQRVIRRFRPLLESGSTQAEAVTLSRAFPDEFVQQIHSAEISGKMDEVLLRMHKFYEEKSSRQSTAAVVLMGGLVFGIVVIVVAYQIISFYAGYFGQINQIIQ
jgi:type II secretory pathway component PulF